MLVDMICMFLLSLSIVVFLGINRLMMLDDRHITALLGAAETLAKAKNAWSGTLILVFQPAEERAGGAQAMVDGGLYDKVPIPDVVVGAHVMPERAGMLSNPHIIGDALLTLDRCDWNQTRIDC
jgi:metal-dependent amidase/aminoacylase/carboxypeptidase family protein